MYFIIWKGQIYFVKEIIQDCECYLTELSNFKHSKFVNFLDSKFRQNFPHNKIIRWLFKSELWSLEIQEIRMFKKWKTMLKPISEYNSTNISIIFILTLIWYFNINKNIYFNIILVSLIEAWTLQIIIVSPLKFKWLIIRYICPSQIFYWLSDKFNELFK